MKIESTVNYDQFRLLKGNRDVSEGIYLKRLIRSIKEENLLSSNPIIVNKDMEVIDGQHRLAAAKFLKEPIYYIISSGADLSDVHRMNDTRKGWTGTDYAKSYAELGHTEYLKLLAFVERNNITVSNALVFLDPDGGDTKNGIRRFHQGNFKTQSWETAEKMADFRQKLLEYCVPLVRNQKSFHRSIRRYILLDKPFANEHLLQKLSQRKEKIQADDSVAGYLRQFEDAINWHVGEDNRVRIY